MKTPFRILTSMTAVLAFSAPLMPAHGQYGGPMMQPPMGAPAMGMPPMGMPMGMPMGVPGMGMPMHPGMQRGGFNPLAALGITQEQQQQLQEIGKQARAVSVDLMNKIANEHQALRALFAEAKPDAGKIGAAYQTIFDFQRQVIENAINVYNQQLDVLNPEQLKKWNAMREQMMSRMMPPPAAGAPKKQQ